jgi:asparagine synthetase A
MISGAQITKMTAAQYLVWETEQELRYEYINSEIMAITGGTIPHNAIDLASLGISIAIEQIYTGINFDVIL